MRADSSKCAVPGSSAAFCDKKTVAPTTCTDPNKRPPPPLPKKKQQTQDSTEGNPPTTTLRACRKRGGCLFLNSVCGVYYDLAENAVLTVCIGTTILNVLPSHSTISAVHLRVIGDHVHARVIASGLLRRRRDSRGDVFHVVTSGPLLRTGCRRCTCGLARRWWLGGGGRDLSQHGRS